MAATKYILRVFIPSKWNLDESERDRIRKQLEVITPPGGKIEFIEEPDPETMNTPEGWEQTCSDLGADFTFLLGEQPLPLQAILNGRRHFIITPEGILLEVKNITVEVEPLRVNL